MALTKNLSEFICSHHSDAMTWIFLTNKNEYEEVTFRSVDIPSESLRFVNQLNPRDCHLIVDQLPSATKYAAQSWLFSLVISLDIQSEDFQKVYKFLFYLKNLGFCRVVNTSVNNDGFLRKYCSDLNVYYDLIPN